MIEFAAIFSPYYGQNGAMSQHFAGVRGQPRVNVLLLNLALDGLQ